MDSCICGPDCSCCSGAGKYALTIVRMTLGVVFMMHGSQMVFGFFGGHPLVETVQFLAGMGLPLPIAYMVPLGELLGGIALFFGFLTRLAALGIMVIMLGAIVTVHWKNGFFINWNNTPNVGHGFEFNFTLIGMCLSLILGGSGACAIDRCQRKKLGD